jgi:hypothetical protein
MRKTFGGAFHLPPSWEGPRPSNLRMSRPAQNLAAWACSILLPPLPHHNQQDHQNRDNIDKKPSKMEPLVGFEPTTCSLRIKVNPRFLTCFLNMLRKLPLNCHIAPKDTISVNAPN